MTSDGRGGAELRRSCTKAFRAYVSRYDASDERIALKVKHTFEVAALADEIARGEGLPARDVDLAWLCGLLHDIGRFEQLRRWGTFDDRASCSHAMLGLRILDEELPSFTEDGAWAHIVRQAVAYHSDLRLSADLTERERLFCVITRDADKVDILRVYSESSCHAVLGIDPSAFACGEISDAALAGFSEHRCLARDERPASLDGLVGGVCLAFEIESPSALRALARRGHLRRLLDRPFGLKPVFADPETQRRWDAIRAAMGAWLVG